MRDETTMTDPRVNLEKQELRNKAIHRAKAPKTNQMEPTNRTHPDPSRQQSPTPTFQHPPDRRSQRFRFIFERAGTRPNPSSIAENKNDKTNLPRSQSLCNQ